MVTLKGSYKELIVWQKAMNLVDEVFDVTEQYPKEHLHVLTNHTRRTAISIPSNIAEGRRRGSEKEFRQYLRVAYASGSELETQIEIAQRRAFGKQLNFTKVDALLNEVMRMLNVMLRK